MDLMTLEDVMAFLGIGRRKATKILTTKGCPVLPRKKGEQYLISRAALIGWLNR